MFLVSVVTQLTNIVVLTSSSPVPICRGHLQHEGRWVRLDLDICQTERWKGTLDGWPNYDIHRFGTEVVSSNTDT